MLKDPRNLALLGFELTDLQSVCQNLKHRATNATGDPKCVVVHCNSCHIHLQDRRRLSTVHQFLKKDPTVGTVLSWMACSLVRAQRRQLTRYSSIFIPMAIRGDNISQSAPSESYIFELECLDLKGKSKQNMHCAAMLILK